MNLKRILLVLAYVAATVMLASFIAVMAVRDIVPECPSLPVETPTEAPVEAPAETPDAEPAEPAEVS